MRIHRSLLEQFKHALVWGTSVKRQSNTHAPRRPETGFELRFRSQLCGSLSPFVAPSLLCCFLHWTDAPQKCGKDHQLEDEDVVQIVKRIG